MEPWRGPISSNQKRNCRLKKPTRSSPFFLGYDGPVKLTPRVPRVVLFYRGELRQFLLGQLRDKGSLTSRQMAEALITIEGKDARDRRMMADIVRRIGKSLRQVAIDKLATREKMRGDWVWTLSSEQ